MEFAPNRSKKLLRIPFFISAVLISAGLVILILGLQQHDNDPYIITGGCIFASGMLLFIIMRFFINPINVHYSIDNDGISLMSFRRNLKVSFNEIQSVVELQKKDAESLMLKIQNQMVERIRHNRLRDKGVFAEQKKMFEFYRFLSVTPVFNNSGVQPPGPRKAKHISLPCNCAFILLKTEEGYIISPLDTAGFVNEVKKYLPS